MVNCEDVVGVGEVLNVERSKDWSVGDSGEKGGGEGGIGIRISASTRAWIAGSSNFNGSVTSFITSFSFLKETFLKPSTSKVAVKGEVMMEFGVECD